MNRRSFVAGFFSFCATVLFTARSFAWELITKDELERENAAPQISEAPSPPAQSGAPAIEIEEPDSGKPIKSPVTIRVRFLPQSGAKIDPSSFQARYGLLGIDITSRIIANAKLDASGLVAEHANIPAGQYRVTLQIADNFHRIGTRVINFRVL
jgi:hypothetical protein